MRDRIAGSVPASVRTRARSACGQARREGREQDARLRVGSGQVDGAVQRHHGLARAGRARDARRPAVVALDQAPSARGGGRRPTCPRGRRAPRRSSSMSCIDAEAALRVGMGEGVGPAGTGVGGSEPLPDGELEQRLLRLLGQVLDDVEDRVLVGAADVLDPVLRHAERHQLQLAQVVEQLRLRRGRSRGARRGGGGDLLDALADLDDLHGARRRVALDAPPLGPAIGLVVVVDVGEQQALRPCGGR